MTSDELVQMQLIITIDQIIYFTLKKIVRTSVLAGMSWKPLSDIWSSERTALSLVLRVYFLLKMGNWVPGE